MTDHDHDRDVRERCAEIAENLGAAKAAYHIRALDLPLTSAREATDSDVIRVAKALYHAEFPADEWNWDAVNQDLWFKSARVAIAAMPPVCAQPTDIYPSPAAFAAVPRTAEAYESMARLCERDGKHVTAAIWRSNAEQLQAALASAPQPASLGKCYECDEELSVWCPACNRDEVSQPACVGVETEYSRLLDRAYNSITAAFGEYVCIGREKLTDAETAEFERNFAVPARTVLRDIEKVCSRALSPAPSPKAAGEDFPWLVEWQHGEQPWITLAGFTSKPAAQNYSDESDDGIGNYRVRNSSLSARREG